MINITTLSDDDQVTENGAYRCSMELYHSQKICPGPSTSSTGIRKLALQSPHSFWKTWEGNPKRYPPKEDNGSLVFGKASHALMLGDEVFNEKFCYVPAGAPQRPLESQLEAYKAKNFANRKDFFIYPKGSPRKPTDAQIAAVKSGKGTEAAIASVKFWEPVIEGGLYAVSDADLEGIEKASERVEFWAKFDRKAKGRHFLKAEDVVRIEYMAENLAANPMAVEVLKSDLIEISMIWQDPITGLWLKSRPDCIPTNGYDFGDLKTFAPKSRDLIIAAQRSVTDFGYPLQMALAIMGAEAVLGTTAETCALVFLQTSEPYEVIPVEIDAESLYWAKVLIRKGLDAMKTGLDTGDWPGITQEIVKYSYPPSMLHRFGEMQINGQLPSLDR